MTDKLQELSEVRKEADALGIKYHHKAGADTIRDLIDRHNAISENLNNPFKSASIPGATSSSETSEEDIEIPEAAREVVVPLTADQYRKKEAKNNRSKVGALLRVRIKCFNELKKEWPGEILSVGSAKLGTFKKYVPYNSSEPYHIPKIIYDMMKEKKCSQFYNTVDDRGNKIRKSRLIDEYAIEVLDTLDKDEIKDLAYKQSLQRG